MRAAAEMIQSLESIRAKYFPEEDPDGIWTPSRTLAFVVGCMAAREVMRRPDPEDRIALEVDYLGKVRAGFRVAAVMTEAMGGPDVRRGLLRLTHEDLDDDQFEGAE